MEYGLISVVPAVILILFALKTRRTFEALIIGTFVTYIIIKGPGFLTAWIDSLFEVLTDYDVQWVIIVCGLFGSLIALLEASNGTISFTEKMASICKSAKSSLVVTWIMGMLIFIDDYLNIITLGTCMCPLTDRYKEPREATSYIIDSTAAPVCVLLPISTWSIFYASMFFCKAGNCGAWFFQRDFYVCVYYSLHFLSDLYRDHCTFVLSEADAEGGQDEKGI